MRIGERVRFLFQIMIIVSRTQQSTANKVNQSVGFSDQTRHDLIFMNSLLQKIYFLNVLLTIDSWFADTLFVCSNLLTPAVNLLASG